MPCTTATQSLRGLTRYQMLAGGYWPLTVNCIVSCTVCDKTASSCKCQTPSQTPSLTFWLSVVCAVVALYAVCVADFLLTQWLWIIHTAFTYRLRSYCYRFFSAVWRYEYRSWQSAKAVTRSLTHSLTARFLATSQLWVSQCVICADVPLRIYSLISLIVNWMQHEERPYQYCLH